MVISAVPLIGGAITVGAGAVLVYLIVKSKMHFKNTGEGGTLDTLYDEAVDLALATPGKIWGATQDLVGWGRTKLDKGDVLAFMKKVTHEVEMVDGSFFDILNSSKTLEHTIKDIEKEIKKENA